MSADFQKAIQVFVHGFAFTRSFTHPYLTENLHDRVTMLRDAPRKSGDYRSIEIVASDIPIADLDALVREKLQQRFRLCYLLPTGESDIALRRDFKERGYRLMSTEELMIHRLSDISLLASPSPIVRVTTIERAERLARAAGRRQILPEHLEADPAPMRQYMAQDGETPIGWVNSVVVGNCTWCAGMYVEPAYRRRGIARALLSRMLLDDREYGSTANILLASHAGSKLYPTVGYESLGRLYLFTPPKPSPGYAQTMP